MDYILTSGIMAVILGALGGAIFGWISGNRMREDYPADAPLVVYKKGGLLLAVGVGLILVNFFSGIWFGVAAVVIGFLVNTVVGSKVLKGKTGFFNALQLALVAALVIGIPFGAYQTYQYNRTPNEADRLSFIYECDNYLANDVFKGDNSRDRDTAKAVCGCLWPDLVGRYKSIGLINEKARPDGPVSIADGEVNDMAGVCIKDYHNSN